MRVNSKAALSNRMIQLARIIHLGRRLTECQADSWDEGGKLMVEIQMGA
jgi:hypothetical protein